MALLDPANSLRVPGRLIEAPTNLGIPAPYGGTDLGLYVEVAFRPSMDFRPVDAEEFGGETVDYVYTGTNALIAVFLRGLNNDAMNRLFPNTAVGGVSGDTVISHSGSVRSGSLVSAKSVKLLFAPEDVTKAPSLILYRALPLIEETAEINFSIDQDAGLAAVFQGIRDATSRVFALGKLVDLTL